MARMLTPAHEQERQDLADALAGAGYNVRIYGYSLQVLGSEELFEANGDAAVLKGLGFQYSQRKGMFWRKWWEDEAA